MNPARAAVILPAHNEEGAVASVVHGFRATGAHVLVVDNASTDRTTQAAINAGADVVHEPRLGYGAACLRGLEHLRGDPPPILVFADCDGTLDPRELPRLLEPLQADTADLVLGRRARLEPGSMPWHQRFGNDLVLRALNRRLRARILDIPPYRAARADVLYSLDLREPTYGFPIETVTAAVARGFRVAHVDVSYARRRTGKSKVTGSLVRSLRAGTVMMSALRRTHREASARTGTVLVFARAPELGHVKTRLAARHAAHDILALYRAMLADTLRLARLAHAHTILAHTPGPAFPEQGLADVLLVQNGSSFAERFDDALRQARAARPEGPLVVIGADAPHMPVDMLTSALAHAREGRVPIGPAPRGGFYLLGFPRASFAVGPAFDERRQTEAIERLAQQHGLSVARLHPWYDIDEPDDLDHLAKAPPDGIAWSCSATARILSDGRIARHGAEALPLAPKTPAGAADIPPESGLP